MVDNRADGEGVRSPQAAMLLWLYRLMGSESIRVMVRKRIINVEGGQGRSLTIRKILREYYGVEIGLFSSGILSGRPGLLHRGTSIGRHSYVAATVRTFTRHHPRNTKSTHGLFYNPELGVAKGPPVRFGRLQIGHGVLIEHGATILHPAETIGDGAIVTAGAVVYENVRPYTVVAGNPATVVKSRFPPDKIQELLASEWWRRSAGELKSET